MPNFVRSLRFRLAAAFFLWTALFVAMSIPLVYRVREVLAFRDLDGRIAEFAAASRDRVARVPPPPGGDPIAYLLEPSEDAISSARDVIIQLRGADGAVLAESAGLIGLEVPFDSATVSRRVEPARDFRTASLPPREHPGTGRRTAPLPVRLATIPLEWPGIGPCYLLVGRSLKAFYDIQWAMTRILLVAGAVGLVGAALAGWIVAGIFTRRLASVAEAVRAVSPTRLDSRASLPSGEDEIGQLGSDVGRMLDRLAAAFRSQDNFISDVSHELKTPISVMLTEAQVLRYVRPEHADYRGFANSVEEEMRRLGKLVESFLLLARFQHGRQVLTDSMVPINDAALEAVEHAGLLSRQYGVGINLTLFDAGDTSPEALVRGDAELLRVVVDNLLRNAIQVSERGSSVDVSIALEGERSVIITVADHGPGIPAEHIDHIFDRFFDSPAGQNSHRRGTGLGLTIAKGVVDLHGGTITARNRSGSPGSGCIFTVRLPIARSSAYHVVAGNGKLPQIAPLPEADGIHRIPVV